MDIQKLPSLEGLALYWRTRRFVLRRLLPIVLLASSGLAAVPLFLYSLDNAIGFTNWLGTALAIGCSITALVVLVKLPVYPTAKPARVSSTPDRTKARPEVVE